MKDNWKNYALAAAVGALGITNIPIVGGTDKAAQVAQIEEVENRLLVVISENEARALQEISYVKEREARTYEVVVQLSIAVARLEEKIDAALAR